MAARLPYLERDQAPPDVQATFDTLQQASGRVLNFTNRFNEALGTELEG
ncbi:MAG TPA: hypothetical protein VGT40_21580 [Methylomirabilota bacterium]|jgi:hypothetical protein|nr:hypothetical protein [Methylomirabilota bacterium]